MFSTYLLRASCFAVVLFLSINPAVADLHTVIMQGDVVMSDGSPPPRPLGIERVCSDRQGSASGPITDKKGHYLWSQVLDPTLTRVCYLKANLPGFVSTEIDISNLSVATFAGGAVEKTLPDLVLSPRDSADAGKIVLIAVSEVPGKAQTLYKAAEKALEANDMEGGIQQLQLAVKSAPKFADGWSILGAVYERQQMLKEARDAAQRALEINPKLVSPYLRIARTSNKLNDWAAAAKAEEALLAAEKRYYPEIYLQQAYTRAALKDYAGAEESAKTALSLDPRHLHVNRAEYVLGRIALQKGDLAAAKEHIARYIQIDPTAPDLGRIQAQLENLGNPAADILDIPLQRP